MAEMGKGDSNNGDLGVNENKIVGMGTKSLLKFICFAAMIT